MSFVAADIFGGGGTNYASVAAQQEATREANITQGTTAINNAYAGFTPQFYQNYASDYVANEEPQLGQQYQTAKNQIGFNLANRGLSNSGTANTQWDALATTMGQSQQQLVDQGQTASQNLEQNVQASQSNELNTLYNSADPAQAGSSAIATAASFSSTPAVVGLSNMFSNLLNQYYVGQLINNYNTSLAGLTNVGAGSATGAAVNPSAENFFSSP
jgi:hypothetical protein